MTQDGWDRHQRGASIALHVEEGTHLPRPRHVNITSPWRGRTEHRVWNRSEPLSSLNYCRIFFFFIIFLTLIASVRTFEGRSEGSEDRWSHFNATRSRPALCRWCYSCAFPGRKGGIRITGKHSRYLTGFARPFHHQDSGEMCQVITPLVKSEWEKVLHNRPRGAEAASCLSGLKALFSKWLLRFWLGPLIKQRCVSASAVWGNRAASAESFTATTDKRALFIQKRQKRNVWNKLQLNGLPGRMKKRKENQNKTKQQPTLDDWLLCVSGPCQTWEQS